MTRQGDRSGSERADPPAIAHFRIIERLGRGGMGVVYRAEDETLRRTVALKLLPSTGGDTEARQRFLREARSAAAISHPNVATIHQVGEADGRLYIAMELIEGESLRTRLGRGRLDLVAARELAGQMARGLAAAHEKGIVHRDLKPENVMITPAGVVKLLDFGLAKLDTAGLVSGPTDPALARTETLVTSDRSRILGTAEYMSPEQALGRPLDVRSDVFSFGVVLYEMLAGARPFGGLTTGEMLVAIARDPAPPLRARAPEVDSATDALIMRCLAKQPAERFANAGEVVATLAWRSSGVVTESLTKLAPVARALAGPRRAWALGGAVALLVAVAATLAATSATRRSAVPVASAAARPAPSATTMTDLPAPTTRVPAAAREFAQAMQAWRDASTESADKHLLRAVQLDPSLAIAHALLALGYGLPPTEQQRRHLATAVELRAQLGERDAAVLEVIEQTLGRAKPDVEDAARRWKALADRYPVDAFIVAFAGAAGLDAGRRDEGFALLDRAVALDPKFAAPIYQRARFLLDSGDLDGALAAANRCLAVSPSAVSCLHRRAEVEQRLGQCARLEDDAHRMIALDPDGAEGYSWLATALAARGAPTESVAESYRHAREHAPTPAAKAFSEVTDPIDMADLVGDFATATAAFPALEAFAASQTNDAPAHAVVDDEVFVFVEVGRPDRAADAAEAYLKRLPALTSDDPLGGRGRALWARHLAGRIPGAEFRAEREAWASEAAAKLPSRFANNVWWVFYAETSVTAADAREALEALPRYSPLPPFDGVAYCERLMGHVLLLAGRGDEAIPHLRRALTECYGGRFSWSHQIAAGRLGEALEQKGDRAGACEAVADVLAHWGHAKPRSVTADMARARSKALGCGR